jgi:translation initiation factor 2 subunit 1
MFRKEEWPEVGELVVATVRNIVGYGAYVRLDEYDKEGFLHISEISSSWVRNIRNHVRERQKVVLKVLRVNTDRGHVDLTLRRVTKRERIEKMLLWKRSLKAESLLRSTAKKLDISVEELYDKAGTLIEKSYGDLYDGLERVAKDGIEVLLKMGIPNELAAPIAEVAKEKIKISIVKVKGILNLVSTKPNGVQHIKKALLSAQNVRKPKGTKVDVHVVAPPRYRIEVSARGYKEAEALLKRSVDTSLAFIKDAGGEGSFSRS